MSLQALDLLGPPGLAALRVKLLKAQLYTARQALRSVTRAAVSGLHCWVATDCCWCVCAGPARMRLAIPDPAV